MMLKITGDLLIPDVSELRQEILPCLAVNEHVSLDLRGVGEVDTAGVQLLLSACRSNTTAGNKVMLVNIPPGVLQCAAQLGLDPSDFSETGSGGGQCPK